MSKDNRKVLDVTFPTKKLQSVQTLGKGKRDTGIWAALIKELLPNKSRKVFVLSGISWCCLNI